MNESAKHNAPTRRQRRVSDQIQVEIADILGKQVRDPRLAGLSVTAVKISPDLRQATVYVSSLPGQSSRQQILLSLDHARGFVRGQLATRLRLRVMPDLSFRWDNSLETGDRISRLLDSLHLNDQDASQGQDVAP
ncbi:MAG: 30S ribosome-binding factor RbfA [Thermoflexales bacterium]|nr:30S ribosome-binding factor RbfA [Thermoflexales bacterium]